MRGRRGFTRQRPGGLGFGLEDREGNLPFVVEQVQRIILEPEANDHELEWRRKRVPVKECVKLDKLLIKADGGIVVGRAGGLAAEDIGQVDIFQYGEVDVRDR